MTIEVEGPDGVVIEFPDGTGPDAMKAALAKHYGNPQSGYANSYLGQGVSGLAEGVANTAGFAGDVYDLTLPGLAARAGRAIGGAAAKAAGLSDKVNVSGAPNADQIKEALAGIGAIQPRSRDRKKQIVRRVAQGVGEVAPFAAAGVGGAARTLVSGAASGAGGAIGQQIAPDDPSAEAIGALLGGLSPTALESIVSRASRARAAQKAIPTTEALKAEASGLFTKAEQTGFTADGTKTQALHSSLRSVVSKSAKLDAALATKPKVRAALKVMKQFSGDDMTPSEMLEVRQVIQDAAQSFDASEARVGTLMLRRFDDFTSGFAPEFREARQLWSRAKKAEVLELATERARDRAGGYNADTLSAEYRAIAQRINKKELTGFRPEEIAAIRKVSRGTPVSKTAEVVGKLAPSKNPLSVIPTVAGGAAGGPAGAAGVAALGYGGRALSTFLAVKAASTAELLVRAGVRPEKLRTLSPQQMEALAAVLAAQLSHAPENASEPDSAPPTPQ